MERPLIIGTRGSLLALAQTRLVVAELARQHPSLQVRVETISTHGDQHPDMPLHAVGQKGIFTGELEAALLDGRIDLAVHSAKDLPVPTPPGLAIICTPPREDPRDALIAGRRGLPAAQEGSGFRVQGSGGEVSDRDSVGAASDRDASISLLPHSALIGTSSLRRQAHLARLRPDLRFDHIRGNIETRIAKVRRGEFDATLLALAGLRRAGLAHEVAMIFPADVIVPAPGQGTLALEGRADDRWVIELLAALDHAATGLALRCERAIVSALGATCRTPIGALAEGAGDVLAIRASLVLPDGSAAAHTAVAGPTEDHAELVARVIEDLHAQGADRIIAACS